MNSALAAEEIPSPEKPGFFPTHHKIVILTAKAQKDRKSHTLSE
jgi:hypothetical protein